MGQGDNPDMFYLDINSLGDAPETCACLHCGGTGVAVELMYVQCVACSGIGRLQDAICRTCGGYGRERVIGEVLCVQCGGAGVMGSAGANR